MNPRRTTDPTSEPLSLAEVKAQLRIEHADEDATIVAMIVAARDWAEEYTRRGFITQTWTWTLNAWPGAGPEPWWDGARVGAISELSTPGKFLEVPRGPLQSVTSIKFFDDDDTETLWASTNYYVAGGQNRIYRRSSVVIPSFNRVADGIEVVYKAGYGDSFNDVPMALRQGLQALVAHLWEHRGDGIENSLGNLPEQAIMLLNKFKVQRL